MTVLVTGVTGFTGGHLARGLERRGFPVRGLVRPSSHAHGHDLEAENVTPVVGDLTDRASLDSVCRGIEVVYHIAASYRTAGQTDDAYRAVNVTGTSNLLQAARGAGVRRFVHCSTGGVHGHVAHPPATEDAPLEPGDIYQVTKLEAERLVRETGAQTDLDAVVVRPIGIYGPGDTRFLKMFRGIARGRFPMLGSGNVFYHLTYIDDLVEGFLLCGETPKAAGRTYILAGPSYSTLNELIALIATELDVSPPRMRFPVWPVWLLGAVCEGVCVPLGVEPPLYRRRVDFFTKSRAFDTTRARTEIGWDPKIDLETGISKTAAWYKEQGLL